MCIRLTAFWVAFVLWLSLPLLVDAQPQLQRHVFAHRQMGTYFRIVLYAPDSILARQAAQEAFARIDSLNARLSDYDPSSELSRLPAAAGRDSCVAVSADLWSVLAQAQAFSRRSGGAFDVSIGPIVSLWRETRRRGVAPDPERLAQARAAVDYRNILLDSAAHCVRLARPGMRLDLGGIAKGYAVDAALAVLRTHGIEAALVDGGGDIVVGAAPPGRDGWRIEAEMLDDAGQPVKRVLWLTHAAVATSGDAYRYVEIGGKRYSHLIDPRSGWGLTDRSKVTVIAPNATAADALASAVSVLGPEAGLSLIETCEGAEALVLKLEAEALQQHYSPSFLNYLQKD
jgi:thiamine biosynthesis lipoprotein